MKVKGKVPGCQESGREWRERSRRVRMLLCAACVHVLKVVSLRNALSKLEYTSKDPSPSIDPLQLHHFCLIFKVFPCMSVSQLPFWRTIKQCSQTVILVCAILSSLH